VREEKFARLLDELLAAGVCCIGQIQITRSAGGFDLRHRDDVTAAGLRRYTSPDAALEIALYDDAGAFRPLKTAPDLPHGWQLELSDVFAVARALSYFYPGRVAALAAMRERQLTTTPLRETLARQSGMYRVAARISDAELDELIGAFCNSKSGCLRTILWKRDASGACPSPFLPVHKFDPAHDQTERQQPSIPLLCQEACNLLVAAAREVVRRANAGAQP
jgi:sirohydrochlorin cobaltochelatase